MQSYEEALEKNAFWEGIPEAVYMEKLQEFWRPAELFIRQSPRVEPGILKRQVGGWQPDPALRGLEGRARNSTGEVYDFNCDVETYWVEMIGLPEYQEIHGNCQVHEEADPAALTDTQVIERFGLPLDKWSVGSFSFPVPPIADGESPK